MEQSDRSIKADLERSNREWRATFDAISDPVSLIDVEGKILKCNKAMTALLDKPFNQVIGRTCWELVHNTTAPIDGCPFTRMRKTLHRESLILPVEDLYFEVTVDPVFDANGILTTAAHIMKDVTQQKKARDALRESEEKYRDLVEGTDDLITRVDEYGTILYTNYRSGKIFGLPPYDCTGISAFDFVHTDDRMKTIQWFHEMIRKKIRRGSIENRQVSRNGDVHHMLWSCRFHFDDRGNTLYINGIARDITGRKRTEAAILKREALYRGLVEGLGDSFLVFFVTLEGKLLYISPSVRAMFGLDSESARNKHWREIANWTEPSLVLAEEKFTALTRGESFKSIEMTYTHPDTSIRMVEVTGRPVRSKTEDVIGMEGIAQDITERKRAQEVKELLIEKLKQALAEVKTLQGFIPICANCKKIRNDEGFWQQIESYIQAHSEAQFSHSICPECAKLLYPHFYHEDDQ